MGDATSISASGMQAASQWLNTTAVNIVNLTAEGTLTSTAASTAPSAASTQVGSTVSQSASPSPAGGSATSSPGLPSFLLAYNPQAPYANMQGMVATPNSDLATEMVHLREAASSFRANLLVFKVSSRMVDSLLNTVA